MALQTISQSNPGHNLSPAEKQQATFKKYVYPDLKGIPTLASLGCKLVKSYLSLSYYEKNRKFSSRLVSEGADSISSVSSPGFEIRNNQYVLDRKNPREVHVVTKKEPWTEFKFTPDAADIVDLDSGKWFSKDGHLLKYNGNYIYTIKKGTLNFLPMLRGNNVVLASDQVQIVSDASALLLGKSVEFVDTQGREYFLEIERESTDRIDVRVLRKELPEAHRKSIEWALVNMFSGLQDEGADKVGMFSLLQFSRNKDAVYLLAGQVVRSSSYYESWTLDPNYKDVNRGPVGSSAARLPTNNNTMVILVSTSYDMNPYAYETAKFLHDEAGVLNVLVSPVENKEAKENRKTNVSAVNKLLVEKNTSLAVKKDALASEAQDLRRKVDLFHSEVAAARLKHAQAQAALDYLTHAKETLATAGLFGKRKAIKTALADFDKALLDFSKKEQ